MNKVGRIVVVDDDHELRGLLQRYLSENGYHVRAVQDGRALDAALSREPADAVILDLMMPSESGLEVCRRLRAGGDTTPIIMLTAKGDPIDRIVGLEMGADDYLPKPFEPRELLARLNAVLRRAASGFTRSSLETVSFGAFVLDLAAMTLKRDGELIGLSSREFALLRALVLSRGRPLSRAQIIETAFGRDAEVTDRAVDVQVARLRRALGEESDPRFVRTVWGFGYVFAHDGTRQ